jgi:diadenosine tetraphosphatase ApaH/serine/threonine PP2A family protein phosphatase
MARRVLKPKAKHSHIEVCTVLANLIHWAEQNGYGFDAHGGRVPEIERAIAVLRKEVLI